MPTTTEAREDAVYALELARDILPDGSSVEAITTAAKKLAAFIGGDEATVAEVAATPEVKTVSFFRVEYNNRKGDGTHWGRPYKTLKGANKNSKNPAFIRAVEFKEVVV